MAAPNTYTVTNVRKDDRGRSLVALEGVNEELGVWVPKDEQPPNLAAQQEIKGWINEGKNGGHYFRPATGDQGGSQSASNGSSGQGRTDATGRSIERQVAAKCATDIVVARIVQGGPTSDRPEFVQNFHFLVDTIADAIQNEGSTNPDDQIPFS